MITFIIALLVLVGGYFLYGSYVERVFGPDKIRKHEVNQIFFNGLLLLSLPDPDNSSL